MAVVAGVRPHPWNQGFRWADHPGPFRVVTPDQAAAFDEHGFFVLEEVIDPDTCAALDREIQPGVDLVAGLLRQVPDGRISVAGLDTQIVAPHLVTRSERLRHFAASPLFAGLCADLVGPDARLYWDQAVYKQPRTAEPVLWHQDNGYTFVEPQAYLTCWVALTDATPDNGCIRVLPGWHRHGTLAHVDTPIGFACLDDPDGAVTVPVRAGSVVVFSSLTPHATGHNRTDAVRKAYILQYVPDGAEILRGDPAAGPPVGREPVADPDRQFAVCRSGEPVGA